MRADFVKPINDTSCKYYALFKFDFKMTIPAGQGAAGQQRTIKEFISAIGK